jgi:hypothetical protein
MHQSNELVMPATMAGQFGIIQIVTRDAGVLLDVQGIERGADGNAYRSHSFARMSWSEAMTLRGLLDEAIAGACDVLKPPVAAVVVLVLVIAGLAHATDAHCEILRGLV